MRPAARPVEKYDGQERKGDEIMKRKEEEAKGEKIPRKIVTGWVDPMGTPMEVA